MGPEIHQSVLPADVLIPTPRHHRNRRRAEKDRDHVNQVNQSGGGCRVEHLAYLEDDGQETYDDPILFKLSARVSIQEGPFGLYKDYEIE